MAPEIYALPNFHLYAGVPPPFVEPAVNRMLVPGQIAVALELAVTVGVTVEVIATVAVCEQPTLFV